MPTTLLYFASGSNLLMIGSFALIAIVFYFLLVRPQKKQEKEANAMRDSLQVGDEITTIGGIIGEIVSIKEETITIETSRDRTKIRFLRTAVRSVDVRAEDKRPGAKKVTPAAPAAKSKIEPEQPKTEEKK